MINRPYRREIHRGGLVCLLLNQSSLSVILHRASQILGPVRTFLPMSQVWLTVPAHILPQAFVLWIMFWLSTVNRSADYMVESVTCPWDTPYRKAAPPSQHNPLPRLVRPWWFILALLSTDVKCCHPRQWLQYILDQQARSSHTFLQHL